jgi:hypothetical protein
MDFEKLWGILTLIVIVVYTIYKTVTSILWLREEKKKTAKLIKEILEAKLENALVQEDEE